MACVDDICILTAQSYMTATSALISTELDGTGFTMDFTIYASDGTTVVEAISAGDPRWGAVEPSSIVVDGLTPNTTYIAKVDAHPEVTETFTTLTDEPRVATESMWRDLANRIKTMEARVTALEGN